MTDMRQLAAVMVRVNQLARAIERISRRVLTTVGRGTVGTVDDTGNIQLLQVTLGEDEIRDRTPALGLFGVASAPPIGADVVVLFVGGDRSNGVILATGDIASRMKNLKPGESALYDSLGKSIYLSADGIVMECGNQPVTINNAKSVTSNSTDGFVINDNVTVNGTIEATGEATFKDGVQVTGAVEASGEGTFNGIQVSTHNHLFEAQAGTALLETQGPQG